MEPMLTQPIYSNLETRNNGLLTPVRNCRLWVTLGWLDIVQNYRRTSLGPWWITANLAIFVIAMTFVYGALFGIPAKQYSAYILGGMIAWYWISALFSEVGNAFLNYTYFIKSTAVDKAQLVWATAFKLLLTFAHHLVLVIPYMVFGIIPLNFYTLQIIPAVAVLFLLSIPVTAVAAILFARYRDLQRFVASAVIILLLVTPIFWQPGMMKGWRSAFVDFNPVHYLVELIRRPLLGQPLDMATVAVACLLTMLAWVGGTLFFRRYQRYVVFWV